MYTDFVLYMSKYISGHEIIFCIASVAIIGICFWISSYAEKKSDKYLAIYDKIKKKEPLTEKEQKMWQKFLKMK